MQPVENRMTADSQWTFLEPVEIKEVLSESGYVEVGTGKFVPESVSYQYALERCLNGTEQDQKEFKDMLTEWFYSGGEWRREDGKGFTESR